MPVIPPATQQTTNMHAYFDASDGNPKVVLKIRSGHKEKEIKALMDTGHTGSLSLSIWDLIEIGAKLSTVGEVEFADGNKGTVYYFRVKVIIDGIEKEIEAGMIENLNVREAIAGLELFSPYIAIIDFNKKKIDFYTEKELKEKKF